jgi:septal ring factor EnvC (AmiA/AmiB activator)
MPTINEVWEQAQQINANLATIHNDMVAIRQRADQTNAWLQDVRGLVAAGLDSLADGVVALQARQDLANKLLAVLLQLTETEICNLEKISANTCRSLNEAVLQTALQKDSTASLADLARMFASAHTDAALELARAKEQKARMDECCPERPPAPPCNDERCPTPKIPKLESPERYKGFEPPPVHDRDHGPR